MQNRKVYFESSPISYATADRKSARFLLIAVGWIAEQFLYRVLRQHAAIKQRVQNGIVQRLH